MSIQPIESTKVYMARKHVEALLQEHLSKDLTFHSLSRTNDVIIACNLIANHELLDAEMHEDLLIAACFHDTGFIKTYENHEEVSIQLAERFTLDLEMSRKRIGNIARLINVTRSDQVPGDLSEKILCDADCFHLCRSNYQEYLYNLRMELKNVLNRSYSEREWLLINLNFLQNHKFYTKYVQENWNEMKLNNLGFIEKVCRVIIPMDSV